MKNSLKILVLIALCVSCNKKEFVKNEKVERATAHVSCEESPVLGKWKAKSDETYIEFRKDCSFESNECDSRGSYYDKSGEIYFDTTSIKHGSHCSMGRSNSHFKVKEKVLTFSFETGDEIYTRF